MYTEDGAVPSKAPAPGDPFLGRIKARSVPPPHRDTANALKLTIAKVEHNKGSTSTSLFLTPYCQSSMGDADKVTALNRIASGPGSTPLDPLAFVVKISGSALESDRRRGHITAEPDTTPDSEIRYRTSIQHSYFSFVLNISTTVTGEVYYLLYADNYELTSKVAFDPEESSLGRIQAVSISPPHSPATIKRCISRVERTPAIAHADLFADITCNSPLKEDYISLLRTDCPGLSPTEPMAIVLAPSLINGRYFIKNRAADIYWNAGHNPIKKIYIWHTKIEITKVSTHAQVNEHSSVIKCSEDTNPLLKWDIRVTHDGNITLISPYAPCSWVSAEMAGSKDPVPWRLIQADSRFRFY